MTRRIFIKLVFAVLFFHTANTTAWSQRSDTLYLNSKWQICEKPFASYYRFGRIVIDTFWFYTGYIADHYLNDTLEMDGYYSSLGEKNGFFSFYYPDGKPKASGEYINNKMFGVWEYYHRNGNLRLRINYTGDNMNYTVLDFIDSTGKVMTKDSTGTFEMVVQYNPRLVNYRLEGEFKNGKRTGTWKYYAYIPSKDAEEMRLKEVYENGVLKKGSFYSIYSGVLETYKKPQNNITLIEFQKLKTTEYFAKDPTSFRNWNNDQDLADFLINRQAPAYDVEGSSFEESFTDVLKTLNTPQVLRYFKDPAKIYNGEVLINLSDSGDIEEIEITGNLSEKEKEYMLFFLKKFKNIHEIIVENVGIDAYHKIYFYSLIFAEFIPKRYLTHLPEKQFLFALIPYDKLKEAIKLKGKKEKKNRSEN
ncbi:MAG: hypothetical protein ABL876_07790 [Chitinophagaceae bacterium]